MAKNAGQEALAILAAGTSHSLTRYHLDALPPEKQTPLAGLYGRIEGADRAHDKRPTEHIPQRPRATVLAQELRLRVPRWRSSIGRGDPASQAERPIRHRAPLGSKQKM